MSDTENFKMPVSIESERAIFSILLMNEDRFAEVSDKLEVRDFYQITSQQIWKAMQTLYRQDVDLDIVSIHSEIAKYESNPQAAMDEVSRCFQNPTSDGNLLKYVNEVKNTSLLRQTIAMLYGQLDKAKDKTVQAERVLVETEKELLRLSDKISDARPHDVSGIVKEIEADWLNAAEHGWRGFETGFLELDKQTGGCLPTHIWIIGAYLGTGKTFFTLQMMKNLIEHNCHVVLFSTEMDRKIVMLRLMSNLCNLGTIKLLKNELTPTEEEDRDEAKEKILTYQEKLIIYDNVFDIEEMRLKLKRLKLQSKVDVVFLDYIQQLRTKESIYESMSMAALDLQKMAKELEITMVIASQVSQDAAGWKTKKAIQYKGAGEIAEVADVGLWLERDKDVNTMMKVHIRKARHGIPGEFHLIQQWPSGRLSEAGSTNTAPENKNGSTNVPADQISLEDL